MRYFNTKLSLILSLLVTSGITVAQDSSVTAKDFIAGKKRFRLSDEEIHSAINEKYFQVKFVGNGNTQGIFQEGYEIPLSTGMGVNVSKAFNNNPSAFHRMTFLGFYQIKLEASINVASTEDELLADSLILYDSKQIVNNQSKFGKDILTPLNSGQAANIQFRGYFRNSFLGVLSGVQVKYAGANRKWGLNADSIFQATTNATRVGVFHEFVPAKHREKYSISLVASYAFNSISGDITVKRNDEVRSLFLNTKTTSFHGLEAALELRLMNIRTEFAYVWLYPNSMAVPGLTNGRLVTTIGFTGGFGLNMEK